MSSCRCCYGCFSLKIRCFIIGYLNLLACILDIGFYVIVASIVSNGFQCDVDENAFNTINWWWLNPILTIVNIGTHGFYPLPVTMFTSTAHADYIPVPRLPKCYPGILHIYLIDLLILLINVIWLKFVFAYVKALHKRDAATMRFFFHVSVVKVVLQIMYYAYQPNMQDNSAFKTHWLLKLADIGLGTAYLFAVKAYATQVSAETDKEDSKLPMPVLNTVQPPTYYECFVESESRNSTPFQIQVCTKESLTSGTIQLDDITTFNVTNLEDKCDRFLIGDKPQINDTFDVKPSSTDKATNENADLKDISK